MDDSFTYTANDGTDDSNVATVSIVYVPQTAADLWTSLQSRIENDALNATTVTTWTEDHVDGTVDGITISRITYELGTLVGTQHTATPVIAAYYARPTGAATGSCRVSCKTTVVVSEQIAVMPSSGPNRATRRFV